MLHYQVTTRRLKIALLLFIVAVLLMGISLDVFQDAESGQFRTAGMGLTVLLLLLGIYAQSVEVRMHPVVNAVWIMAGFIVLP